VRRSETETETNLRDVTRRDGNEIEWFQDASISY
jgi:hypothetical protein